MLDSLQIREHAESDEVTAQLAMAHASSEPLRPTATKLVEWRNHHHGHIDHGVFAGPTDDGSPKVSLEALVEVSCSIFKKYFWMISLYILIYDYNMYICIVYFCSTQWKKKCRNKKLLLYL
mgnify:FL=1